MIDTATLQSYLHENIPLSRTMGVEVVHATIHGVTLAAPLAPNINHRDTVFGGSAAAVAILSAWALLYLRLKDEGLDARVVIQKNTINYERPIVDRFTASCVMTDDATWTRFINMLTRRHRARISVASVLHCNDEQVGDSEGDFVALVPPPA